MSDAKIFMPGIAKPLNEWSLSALEQIRSDIARQISVEASPKARAELETHGTLLLAEAKRRAVGLSPEELGTLRDGGHLEPFTARLGRHRANDEQLSLRPVESLPDRDRQLTDDRTRDRANDHGRDR